MAKETDVRGKVCLAAIKLAADEGILAVTLDGVAKAAGLSKGGLIYHFPSKELLLKGMVAHFGQQVEELLQTRMEQDPEPRFRLARTFLDCAFGPAPDSPPWPGELDPALMNRFILSLLSAAVHHPNVLKPLQELGHRLQQQLLAQGDAGLEELLIWLAVDGLFFWQFVGLIRPEDPRHKQIEHFLRDRCRVPSTPTSVSTGERA